MTENTASQSKPTTRQLAFLRSLALKTATSFQYPRTRNEASAEIGRLLRLRERGPSTTDVPVDRDTDRLTYATAVHEDEITGYGVSAAWRSHAPGLGEGRHAPAEPLRPVELGRYCAGDEERILCVEIVRGQRRVFDRPASGGGRCYLVERDCAQDDQPAMGALVRDYLGQAEALDAVPMASQAIRQLLRIGGADV